jgi:YVTN family beta-propeller protein
VDAFKSVRNRMLQTKSVYPFFTRLFLGTLLGVPGILLAQTNLPAGNNPYALAVNPATNRIYIANSASNNVTVIDGTTNATTTVSVGTAPAAVAVNPVTNKIYVANAGSSSVTVIDGATNATRTVAAGTNPNALAVNALTNRVYVSNSGSNNVTVIDETSGTASTITSGAAPYAVAVNPVTNKIYVANSGSANVTVIDGGTNGTTVVPAGLMADAVAVNPVSNKIYIVNQGGNTVTIIDGVSNTVSTISVGASPVAVAVNPVTNKVYVADAGSNDVTVIDGASNATSTVTAGNKPFAVAINSATNKIYVANQNSGNVTVIDGAGNGTGTVVAGISPGAVAVNPVTNMVFVANKGSANVTTFSGAVNNVIATVITGPLASATNPMAIALNPVTNKIYVPNSNGNSVTVIDGVTNTAISVPAGTNPNSVAVNPVTNKIYVPNLGSNNVTVIDGATNSTSTIPGLIISPYGVAVNPVTNKIYITQNTSTNNITVIDGASNTILARLTSGVNSRTVAVNPVTNKIYVAIFSSAKVAVIDGATNTIVASPAVGNNPFSVAVNPVTNKIYVTNYSASPYSVAVIDGVSDTVTATIPTGSGPQGVAVNPITNNIYTANYISTGTNGITVLAGATNVTSGINGLGVHPQALAVNTVTNQIYAANAGGGLSVIDAASNKAVATISVGSNPNAVAVNPVTNRVYVLNQGSTSVSVIAVDNHQGVPLTTTVNGVVDAATVSTTNVFQTLNPAPSFTVDVTSAFGAANPPPTQVYYEIDGANPSNLALAASSNGANPGHYNVTLPPQQVGLHTLYVYAAYGNEGGHNSGGNGTGNSPEMGDLTTYLFLIIPVPTTITLTSDVNPQISGNNITFTAVVRANATAGAGPTGSISFFDGATPLGTVTVAGGMATLTTNALTVGLHPITAVYSGDSSYNGSSSPVLTQSVVLTVVISAYAGSGQSASVGTVYAAPLKALVTDSSGNPISGTSVTFTLPVSGASGTFGGSVTVTTDANGIATSPVLTANSQVGTFQVSATTPAGTAPTVFNLTNTAGAANKLAFVQQPTDTSAGTNMSPAVTVQLQDSAGNPVLTPGVPITLQLNPVLVARLRGLQSFAAQNTDATGLATFANLSINQVGRYELLAEGPSVSSRLSSPFNILAGAPATISATGGTPQNATILTGFVTALQTTVTDAFGNPVSGVTVNFVAPGTGASATLSAASAVTDSSGIAQVTATATAAVGSYVVTATTAGVTGSAKFALTNLTGAPSQISFAQQPTDSMAAVPISPSVVVQVADSAGNPVSGASVTIALQENASLLLGTLTATTDPNGRATFADLSVNVAGTYHLSASSGISTISNPFQIVPSQSSTLISVNGGSGQSTALATAYPAPLRALVTDSFGNPISGAPVTFTAPASGAGGSFDGSATVNSDAGGVAAAPLLTANSQTGTFQVRATTPAAAAPAIFILTNVGIPASKLAFVQQPTDAAAGATLSPPVTVVLEDSFGNTVQTAGVPITLQLNPPASTFAPQITDANGVATFAALNVNQAGTYQLLAISNGFVSATSLDFAIRAGAASAIRVTGGGTQSATVLTAFAQPLQVTVTDAYNNPVSGFLVSFTSTGTGASATLSLPSAITDANGVASVTAIANATAGSYSVTTSITGGSTSPSFALTNVSGPASQIIFEQQPSNASAGVAISPAVVARVVDGGGNPVSGVPVTISLQGGSATLNGTLTGSTDANGDVRFNDLSINASGNYQLVATSGAIAKVSDSFSISAARATVVISVYDGDHQSAAAGSAYGAPLKVQVQDVFGNALVGIGVTFSGPSSGAGVSFNGPTTVNTDSHGIATSPSLTANSQGGLVTVLATTPGAAAPATFSLTNISGGGNQLIFVQQPTDTAAGQTISPAVTVQLQDSSGNPLHTAGVPIAIQSNAVLQRRRLFSGNATQNTDASGLATFANLSIAQVGTYQLLASATGTASATSSPFNIAAGVPSRIQPSAGTPQSAIILTVYGTPLQVTVTDAVGNPVSGVAVLFTAPTSGPAGLFGGQSTLTANTDAQGHASAVITANGVAGAFGVTATSSAITGVTLFNLTNLPSGSGSLAFVQQPSDTPSGQTFAPPVTVQVRNNAGNPAQVAGVPVLLSLSSGTGTLFGTVVQLTDANGVATFADLQIGAAGRKTLRATSAQQSPADSTPFQITVGKAAAINVVSGSPQSTTVLQPFPAQLQVQVTDAAGNPVSGAPVAFALSPSGPGGTFSGGATVAADANGFATSPTLTANSQPGSFLVTASTTGVGTPAVFALTNLPQPSSAFVVGPSSLTFGSEINQPAPPAQTLQITTVSTLSWTATSSATWLTVSPSNGTGSAQINVSVNPQGLSAGTYSGFIRVSDSTGDVVLVPVTYVISDKPALIVRPPVLVFTAATNTVTPLAQTLQTTSSSRSIAYTATAQVATPSGGTWLQVSPLKGQTVGTATVSVNPAGLSEGVYNGSILFAPTESSVNSVAVPVTFIVGCQQGGCALQPNIITVVNGASFHPSGAPGAAMTIFGTNLSDNNTYPTTAYPLPTKLGPTSVTVNGVPAPLYYVSPTQINFQMPSSAPAAGVMVAVNNTSLTSSRALPASPSHTAALGVVDPGLFVNGNRAAALNGDLSFHTAATPIPAGGYVLLFITGQGPVTPPAADGNGASSSPLSIIDGLTQVMIGGKSAQITYKGLAPGWAGLAQLNVIVPTGLAPGDQPLFVTINGLASNSGVITVK